MLASDEFLTCHSLEDVFALSCLLQSNRQLPLLLRRMAFFDPNYGLLWVQWRECFLSNSKEVGARGAADG